jgi:hypothetical protein
MAVWFPNGYMKDGTPVTGPFKDKPTDGAIELVVNGDTRYVIVGKQNLTENDKAEIVQICECVQAGWDKKKAEK